MMGRMGEAERRVEDRRKALRRVDDDLADRIEALGLSRRGPQVPHWASGRRRYTERRKRPALEGKE